MVDAVRLAVCSSCSGMVDRSEGAVNSLLYVSPEHRELNQADRGSPCARHKMET